MERTLIDYRDGVKLYDYDGVEIISWTEEEWAQEPEIVVSIIEAITVILIDGPEKLKSMLEA